MFSVIEAYIKDKELAWSAKTKISTVATLRKVSPYLTGDPLVLWNYLKENQKPYSRVTTWVRVSQFWDFARPKEVNPYHKFRKKNKLLFKNAYVRRPASLSFKEAIEKIESLSDPAIKRKALELLYSGMRWSEPATLKADGFVVGKGDLEREVFLPEITGPEYKGSYRTFLRALKDVGLKTHTLRKVCLTQCVKDGANIFELRAFAGWKNLESAKSYIGVDRERLKDMAKKLRRNGG